MKVPDNYCQCILPQCIMSAGISCDAAATQEDFLCDRCREVARAQARGQETDFLQHCHACSNKASKKITGEHLLAT